MCAYNRACVSVDTDVSTVCVQWFCHASLTMPVCLCDHLDVTAYRFLLDVRIPVCHALQECGYNVLHTLMSIACPLVRNMAMHS